MSAKLLGQLGFGSRHRVVPVSGPPGAGKTYAISVAFAGMTPPGIHFRARRYHAALIPFARALVDSLAPAIPSLRTGFRGAVARARRSPEPALVLGDWLAKNLGSERRIIALDDLHLIEESVPVRAFIIRAITASATPVRWIIAARDTHLWPLATWLATSIACVPVAIEFGARSDAQKEEASRASLAAWLSGLEQPMATTARALALLPALRDDYLATLDARETIAAIAAKSPFAFSGDRFTASVADMILDATREYHDGALALLQIALAGVTPSTRLQVFTELNAHGAIVDALNSHGFELLDGGEGDIVEEAVEHLSHEERRSCALAVSLEAKREMELGRHDVGESWYLHAARIAPSDAVRARVELAHASELLRRSRFDAIEILERIVADSVSPTFDAMAAATLAAAYAATERWEPARSTISKALAWAEEWPEESDIAVRALVYRQAAYVSLRDGDAGAAGSFARRAIAAAELSASDDIIAAALSVLVVVAVSHLDDGDAALEFLERLERCADRLGNAFLLRYSRLAQLDNYGDRAMWPQVDRIEALLSMQELENDARHTDETLVRTRALRSASAGNFLGALRLLQAGTDTVGDPELLALRQAEMAVYAAAGNDVAEGKRAIAGAEQALDSLGTPRENALVIRTNLYIALADFLTGDVLGARRRLAAIEPATAAFPRMRSLADAIRSVLAFGEGRSDRTSLDLLQSLGALHTSGLGGAASILGALPCARSVRLAS